MTRIAGSRPLDKRLAINVRRCRDGRAHVSATGADLPGEVPSGSTAAAVQQRRSIPLVETRDVRPTSLAILKMENGPKKLADLRVVDLRNELEKRGLEKTGVKAVLSERLQKALHDEGLDAEAYLFETNSTPSKSAKKDKSDGDEEYLEMEDDQDDDKTATELSESALDPDGQDDSRLGDLEVMDTLETSESMNRSSHAVDKEPMPGKTEGIVPKKDDSAGQTAPSAPAAASKEANADAVGDREAKIKEDDVSLVVHVDESEENLDYDLDKKGSEAAGGESRRDVPTPTKDEGSDNLDSKAEHSAKSGGKDSTSSVAAAADANEADTKTPSKSGGLDLKKSTLSAPKESQDTASIKNLWISGLSSDTKATDLKAAFSKHGKVVGAKVVTNAKKPGARCYGFLTMSTAEEASKCIQYLNKTELHGRTISVEKAKSDPAAQAREATKRAAASSSSSSSAPSTPKMAKTSMTSTPGSAQPAGERKDKEEPKKEARKDDKVADKKDKLSDEKKEAKPVEKKDLKPAADKKDTKPAVDKKDLKPAVDKKDARPPEKKDIKPPEKKEIKAVEVKPAEAPKKTDPKPADKVEKKEEPKEEKRSDGPPAAKKDDIRQPNRVEESREEKLRQKELALREDERRRRALLLRDQRRIVADSRHIREEQLRVDREKERIRQEREKLNMERDDVMRLEREKQRLDRELRELREKCDAEREELKRLEQARIEEQRKAQKRAYDSRASARDESSYWSEPKRQATDDRYTPAVVAAAAASDRYARPAEDRSSYGADRRVVERYERHAAEDINSGSQRKDVLPVRDRETRRVVEDRFNTRRTEDGYSTGASHLDRRAAAPVHEATPVDRDDYADRRQTPRDRGDRADWKETSERGGMTGHRDSSSTRSSQWQNDRSGKSWPQSSSGERSNWSSGNGGIEAMHNSSHLFSGASAQAANMVMSASRGQDRYVGSGSSSSFSSRRY